MRAGLQARGTGVQVPFLVLPGCVLTTGKSFNLSVSQATSADLEREITHLEVPCTSEITGPVFVLPEVRVNGSVECLKVCKGLHVHYLIRASQ